MVSVLTHPTRAAFEVYLPTARWAPVWISVLAQAIVVAGAVALALRGPVGANGVSSLPVGPKLYLHVALAWITLAALVGSIGEFFLFSGLLALSARRFGGRGGFLPQCYALALFWPALIAASAAVELFGTVGSLVGVLLRLYALVLLAPALAAVHRLSLARAWAALLSLIVAGLALGLGALAIVGSRLPSLVR